VTTSLLDRIKADRLAAAKARDARRRDLLGTLLAAAAKDAKVPDDAQVARTARAFLKALDETAGLVEARGGDASAQRAERAILEAYLPKGLSDEELRAAVAEAVAALPEAERGPKATGRVMAALKARHGEALDARAAGAAVRAALGG
jgi:uncharacterized protein